MLLPKVFTAGIDYPIKPQPVKAAGSKTARLHCGNALVEFSPTPKMMFPAPQKLLLIKNFAQAPL
jgi:hypothetical protein